MSTEPQMPPITCPSSLVASCPPLLGFTPDESLVVLIRGVPRRVGPVVMRVDLPHAGEESAWAQTVAASVAGTRGAAVDAVLWTACGSHLARGDLPTDSAARALLASLDRAGIEATEMVTTNGHQWWSHMCQDPGCCPPGPSELDPVVVTAVRAEYAYVGRAPLASRASLAERIRRDPVRGRDVRTVVGGFPPPQDREAWRDREIEWVAGMLRVDHAPNAPGLLRPAAAGRLHRALADVAVRDTVARRLLVDAHACGSCDEHRMEVLCDALRAAPERLGAPAATLLGLLAWSGGEGALGSVAIERALQDEPGYRLAELLRRMMSAGLDPNGLRVSVGTLTEQECRAAAGRVPGRREPGDDPASRVATRERDRNADGP